MALLRRPDLWLPPLLLMVAIFFFSAQPSLDSGLGWIDSVGRKLVHFGEYALLCFLWWRLLQTLMPDRRAALVAFLVSIAYAATDELHQSYVDGRHGTPVDWAIDSAGAAAAALAVTARRRVAA
ncbi:MAG TPA: VanZ family protein [Thermoleophilaceae bacterium]|nr:VanZ family protein [Thermoleophilaceae bacterium]